MKAKIIQIVTYIFFLFLMGSSFFLQAQKATPLIDNVLEENPDLTLVIGSSEGIIRSNIVTINAIETEEIIELNLFKDIQIIAKKVEVDFHKNGAIVWRGQIDNQEWGYVLISQYKSTYWVKATLDDGRIFQIQPTGNNSFQNEYLLSEVIGADGQDFECEEKTVESIRSNSENNNARQNLTSVCDAAADCSGQVVHIMVVYTPSSSLDLGGAAATESAIAMAVSEMNTINTNSGVNHSFNLTHTQEINYQEESGSTDYGRLWSTTDGYIDEVHVLRNQYGADVVSMVVTSACGIAHVNTNPTNYSSSVAFSIVGTGCMVTNKSLAHEVGHNMGLRHDRYAYGSSLPAIACDWAWGFVNPNAIGGAADQQWRTVMAYNDYCLDNNTNCVRIPHWSNPNINYNGDPTGVAIGQPNEANSAYMLNRAICLVAGFVHEPPCHPDFLSLKALYAAADGGNWGVNWDTTANGNCMPCSWDGIQCNTDGRVIALDLSNKALNGFIPTEIGWLSELEILRINNATNLSGILPAELGQLLKLKLLDLSNNNLTGGLPNELGKLMNLEKLLLNNNSLTNHIPRKLGTLSLLNKLDLSNNNFTNFLPSSFGILPAIDTLLFNDNQLTGPLPKELANLSNTIDLLKGDNNNFEDCFPVEFSALCGQAVTFLNNANLQYQGDFSQFCANPNQTCNQQTCTHSDYVALETLFTATNGEYWTNNEGWMADCDPCNGIPWNGVNCTGNRVTSIYLINNQLSGAIPSEINQLTELQILSLITNDLTGSIPTGIGQLSNLTQLNLSNNNLIGSIPNEVGLLTNLEYLSLVRNDFVGPLPPDLVNAPLTVFSINGNTNFSSCYPEGYDTFCNINFNVGSTMMLDFTTYCNDGTGECIPGGCAHPDYAALDSLYKSTDGDNWTNNTGWLSDCNPCNWYGVTCNVATNRVQNINLDNNNLTGDLPSNLGDLSNLVTLLLNYNNLTGSIPSTLEQLTNLIQLQIVSNNLTELIPAELGNMTWLSTLNLANNNLIGTIPPELGGMSSLNYLDLANNDLSGSLPSELANLTLSVLRLDNNTSLGGCYPSLYNVFCNINQANFSNTLSPDFQTFCTNGTGACIPDCHPDFSALKAIYSDTDGANWKDNTNWDTTGTPGCNPCNWFGITCDAVSNRVTEINLQFNDLDGVLPDVFVGMDSLTKVSFYLNEELEGNLPNSLGSLSNLTHITFGQCLSMTGPLPNSWSNLTNLEVINLGFSGFTDTIPYGYGNLTNLTYLNLGSNNLSGPIPDEFGNLVNLKQLYLGYNNLDGLLPPSLGNLVLLDFLKLEQNDFEGCYPASYTLFCSDTINTTIYGPNLPSFSEFCTNGIGPCCDHPDYAVLDSLYVATNGDAWTNNTGWLSNCDPCNWYGVNCNTAGRVDNIALNNNNLTGTIPDEIGDLTELKVLNLGDNHTMTGTLPEALGNLSNLQTLAIFDTDISGSIPDTLTKLANLEFLILHQNELTGNIPSGLGDLSNLVNLSLSSNHLDGAIPTTVGNLSNLRQLLLNNNNLSGTIPTQLANLSNLEVLHLSTNQLGGKLPVELGILPSLTKIYLHNNQLSGCFPANYSTSFCALGQSDSGNLDGFDFRGNMDLPLNGDSTAFCGANPIGICQPPSYDDCAGAIEVPINGTATLTNENATTSTGFPANPICHASIFYQGGDIWFKFTTPSSPTDTVEIDLGVYSSDFDSTHFVLYTGNCDNLMTANCGLEAMMINPADDTLSLISQKLLADSTYYVQVYDYGNNDIGEVEVYVNEIITTCDTMLYPDYAALEAFFIATNGASTWTNASGWLEEDCNYCNWYGVSCIGNRVSYLVMVNNNLTGYLPNDLVNLDSLKGLYFPNNNIQGTLPPALGTLDLNYIWLTNNDIEGCIPNEYYHFCTIGIVDDIKLSGNTRLYEQDFSNFCSSCSGACTPATCPPTSNCPQTLFVDNSPITYQTYQAVDSIVSDAVVPPAPSSGDTVVFQAGEVVFLQAGFHAQAGSSFVARIAACEENMVEDDLIAARRNAPVKPSVIHQKFDLKVFPNPFNTSTTIEFALNNPSPVQIQLLDLTGKVLKNVLPHSNYDSGTHQVVLQNDGLQAGIYFLQLTSSEGQVTEKIMVAN